MRKFWSVVVVGLLITAVAAPVSAWEFDMNGLWRWNFDYIAGGGNNGFFGQNNIVNPALVGGPNWAAMNAWVGARKINGQQYGLVTGKDASLATVRAEFLPEFRINNAVRLRGNYQIGGPDHNSIATIPGQALAEASYGLYPTGLNFGKWNVMSTGSWTDFWMSAQTPWGILVAGKREAPWGIGAQYDGGQASSESLGIVAPYGPFRFGLFFQPWAGQTWFNSQVGPQTIFTVSVADAQAFNGTQMLNTNYKLWDNEAKRQVQPLVFVTYDNADLSVGVLYEWFGLHNGPAGAQTEAFATTTARTYDGTREDGSAFLKYNNGRFFTNMELAWTRSQITSQPGMTDGVTSFGGGYGAVYNPGPADGYFLSFNESAAPRYTETWKWMMEVGALCGPAKLTALWSWVPGPDRRGGVWIDNQSWDNVFANPQAFLPYSMLMGYQYGGGLNAVSRNGEGYMSDANSFGVRLDYALAANLNLYFTGFYATRASNGWPWGVMTVQQEMVEPMIANGNTSHTSTGLPINFSTGGGNALLMGQGLIGTTEALAVQNVGGPTSAPNIPDNALGWEITAGCDWKLLEGLRATMRGAYWQPGAWFKYACIDKALVNTISSTGGGPGNQVINGPFLEPTVGAGPFGWAVNPVKTIDPIVMFQGTMQVDF